MLKFTSRDFSSQTVAGQQKNSTDPEQPSSSAVEADGGRGPYDDSRSLAAGDNERSDELPQPSVQRRSTIWMRIRSLGTVVNKSFVGDRSADSEQSLEIMSEPRSSRRWLAETAQSPIRINSLESRGWSPAQARRMERVFMLYARKDSQKNYVVDSKSLILVLRDLHEPTVFITYVEEDMQNRGMTHLDFDMFMDLMNLRFRVDQGDLMDAFATLDSNGDGALDRAEFMNALRLGSKGLPARDVTKLFNLIDANRDGCVTLMEFINLFNRTVPNESFPSPLPNRPQSPKS